MKISVLLLVCFLYLSGEAQKTLLSIDPEIAKNEHKRSTKYKSRVIANDPNGMTAIVLTDEKAIEYMLLNTEMGVVNRFSPSNGLEGTLMDECCDRYFGGIIDKEVAHFLYYVTDKSYKGGKWHFRIENVDFKTNKISSKVLSEVSPGEELIEAFTEGGSFYIITCNNKTSEIVIQISDVNGKVETIRTTMNLEGIAKSKVKLSEYLILTHKYSQGEQSELSGSTALAKIYPYDDKIVFVVVKWEDTPDIWTIDLKTSKAECKQWELNGFYGFGTKKKPFANATIYKENLFVLNQTKDKLEVGVFNMASGQLIKKYEIDESTNLKFVETPVEYNRINEGRVGINTITNNKELIKEVSIGSLGIAIAKNVMGQIILTCGAYDKESGTVTSPSIDYVRVRKVNFRIAVDPSTFDLIPSATEIAPLDKLYNYLSSVEDNSAAANIFRQGDRYFLSAYDKKSKKFSVVEMAE